MSATATEKKDYTECKNPGDFFICGKEGDVSRRLAFLCPCGCGMLAGISVGNGAYDWKWNSNISKITATPSINIMDGPNKSHWHGYLTDGIFKEC